MSARDAVVVQTDRRVRGPANHDLRLLEAMHAADVLAGEHDEMGAIGALLCARQARDVADDGRLVFDGGRLRTGLFVVGSPRGHR
jgi:hypothetical protein